jgi:hypothetical protein
MEESGWWDPAIISEDWHAFLRCALHRGGPLRMRPVFLPTGADSADGNGWLDGLRTYHEQTTRHAWGAEDVGYLYGEISTVPRVNRFHTFRFVQVLHEHVIRVIAWILVVGAYVLNIEATPLMSVVGQPTTTANAAALQDLWVAAQPPPAPDPSAAVPFLFAIGAMSMLGTVGLELWRNPPPPARYSTFKLPLELIFMWMLLPLTGFYLGMLPALKSQTRLMLGIPFTYKVTAKRVTQPTVDAERITPDASEA